VDYNRAVADHVHAVVGAGSLVWVHDYQLFLVPGLLRSRGSAVRIGLSVHTPFDLSGLDDIAAEAIGESLRACDVVGVQTGADLHALREFVATDSVGFVSPVSIDVGLVEAIAGETATRALGARELARAHGRTLIVGVDRLDYTKAVVERLSGYDEAFARGILRPDDVQIVQVAQPTRTTIPEYRDLRLYAERLAHSLNARWARSDGTSPVELRTESLDRRHVMGLLAVADVCMVVPHRDGMNLVAKEFSIVNEASGGVLVLGRGAGAHDELGSASVSVEAATPGAIAASLREALSLQAQRRRAMAADRASAVRRWDASRWSDDFLGRLAGV
jgi:trehalose 6-phosphate synthase